MAIEHSAIPDAKRHEPKGASSAAFRDVMFAIGDGTTEWRTFTKDDLENSGQFEVLDSLTSSNTATQSLTTVDTSMILSYGAAQVSPQGRIEVLSDGTIRFNDDCLVHIETFLTPFKLPSGSSTVNLQTRGLINGSQATPTKTITLVGDSTNDQTTLITANTYRFTAGDIITTELRYASSTGSVTSTGVRGSTADNPAWNDIAGVRISIKELGLA